MNISVSKEISGLYSNFISLATSKLAVMLLSLGGVIVTARVLGAKDYGLLVLLISLVQFFFLASSGWTSNAIVRFGREELLKENSMKKTFWSRSVILASGISAVTLIILNFPKFLIDYLNIQRNDLWLPFGFLITFMLADYGNYLLQASGRMKSYAWSTILERTAYLILLGTIVFIPYISPSLRIILLVMIISKLIQALFSYLSFDKKTILPPAIDKEMLKKIVRYSLPILLLFPTAYISEWGDLWVIKFYLPISSVGIYQLAYQGLLFLTQLYMVITVLLFPLITSLRSEGRENLVKEFLKRITPQIVFGWTMAVSVLVVIGDYVFAFLLGSNFTGGKEVFIILLSVAVFLGISGIYSAINSSYDLLKYSMASSFVTAILNIAGDFLLIPFFGIRGAAFATLFSYFVNAFFYMRVGNRRLKLKTPTTFFMPLPVFLVLLTSLSIDNFLVRMLLFLIIIAISIITVKHLQLFKKQDLKMFKKIQKPKIIETIIENVYIWLEGPTLETITMKQRYEK